MSFEVNAAPPAIAVGCHKRAGAHGNRPRCPNVDAFRSTAPMETAELATEGTSSTVKAALPSSPSL